MFLDSAIVAAFVKQKHFKVKFNMGRLAMIYVVRHGQTDLNRERKMQGRMGLPLNKYGIE